MQVQGDMIKYDMDTLLTSASYFTLPFLIFVFIFHLAHILTWRKPVLHLDSSYKLLLRLHQQNL